MEGQGDFDNIFKHNLVGEAARSVYKICYNLPDSGRESASPANGLSATRQDIRHVSGSTNQSLYVSTPLDSFCQGLLNNGFHFHVVRFRGRVFLLMKLCCL